jgi:hypothetical protein
LEELAWKVAVMLGALAVLDDEVEEGGLRVRSCSQKIEVSCPQ